MASNNNKKNLLHAFFSNFKSSLPSVALITAVSTLTLGIVLYLYIWQNVPISDLTRDTAAIGQLPFYAGFLSQIGICLWAASAMICFFSATVLPNHCASYRQLKRFLFVSASLTLFLGLDDAFLLHETVFPQLGISSKVIYASYGVFFLSYLFRFYKLILRTDHFLLAIALGFFGMSIAIDMLELSGQRAFLFEDGAKFVGILSWLVYFFQTGKYSIQLSKAQQPVGLSQYDAARSKRQVR
ncbi:MAG: hypothetical protein AAGF93_19290 [Cyanobacteria bacterium P01_H01_bin.105]